mmetsp:Transcript_59326/g.111817  ORF Transcript_59326/g.111817 Transcript_59326/m.111817 type:complete len:119 (+) Transcript_59326:103-459(+)
MVRVVVVSDTHNGHERFQVPDGDVFIHCGDLTNRGSAPELLKVNAWLQELPHQHKVVVCGNMDQRMESVPTLEGRRRWLSGATYLEDEALWISIHAKVLWGLPAVQCRRSPSQVGGHP